MPSSMLGNLYIIPCRLHNKNSRFEFLIRNEQPDGQLSEITLPRSCNDSFP